MKLLIILLFGLSVIPAYAQPWDYPITIDMFVEWHNERLANQSIPTTYYIQNIPSNHPTLTVNIVPNAFNEWVRLNPELVFEQVYQESEASIVIQWVNELKLNGENIAGINELIITSYGSSYYQSSVIKIDIADIDCANRIIYRDNASIKDALKHEIGHGLGLEHSNNPEHLMFDPIDGMYNFDNLGYVIPDIITQYDNFIGYDELEVKYYKVEDDFNKHLKRYGVSEYEWNINVEGFDDANFVAFGNGYIDEMNILIVQMNCYVEGSHDWYGTEGASSVILIIPTEDTIIHESRQEKNNNKLAFCNEITKEMIKSLMVLNALADDPAYSEITESSLDEHIEQRSLWRLNGCNDMNYPYFEKYLEFIDLEVRFE